MQSPSDPSSGIIETLLREDRVYTPSPEFKAQANINDPAVYARAEQDPLGFWMEAAGRISWFKQPTRTLDWNPPFARWFDDGVLNASYNCLDRQLDTRGDKTAIIWEGEPGEVRTFTYRDLYREVNRAAQMLRNMGVHKGDRVAIYMPMIPEVVISMLACARLGAPHTVVFGGFSPESLRDRIIDAHAKLVITADGGYRRGGIVPLKQNTDAALDAPDLPVEHVLVVHHLAEEVHGLNMHEGRDVWWHDALAEIPEDARVEPEAVEAEHPLFILYTSGTSST
jgi:acetyl-CoA synthetase